MVPEGWTLTTFESHIDFLSGFAFKSASYTDNKADIKLLRGDNIEPGALRWRDAKRWPTSNSTELAKYKLNEGDFVIAMDRTWISSGLKVAEIKHSDLPCLLVQRVARIRAKETLEQGLLRQYFSSHNFEQYVKSVQTETAVPHISSRQIKDFPLLLPPRQEQTKIAKILSAWDKAIATTERLLANSQQQKQALMQQLLTGTARFPNSEGEWHEVEIGNIIKEVKRPVIWDDEAQYRLLSVKRRAEGVVLREVLAGSQILTKKMNTARAGDFLISKMQVTHGAMGLVTDEFDKHHISDSYIAVIAKDPTKLDINLFSWLGRTKAMWRLAFLSSYGVHIEKLTFNFSLFLKEKINIPTSLAEQQKIAQVLSTADAEIANLQAQLDKLKLEKKALMQQLLTGKRRVRLDDEEEDLAPIRRVG